MARKNFAQLAWDMASWKERERFVTLECATRWIWLETVMTLDFTVTVGEAGRRNFYWDELAEVLNITEYTLQQHVDILLSRGLLRRDEPGEISLPYELRVSPAHKLAKIVVKRPPPALVAVGC